MTGIKVTMGSGDTATGISVTRFPDRKSWSLCAVRGNEYRVLAWFRKDEQADYMMSFLNELCAGMMKPEPPQEGGE